MPEETHECPECGEGFDSEYGVNVHQGMMHDCRYQSEEWLREQYCENRKSVIEIAEGEDVSSDIIKKWLRKNDIQIRGRYERNIDTQNKLDDSGWLKEKYEEEGLTSRDIAEICDCHHTTVLSKLEEYGIERRENHATGEKHPRWEGGYELYYGPNWTSQRRRALERDGYTCQSCGATKRELGQEPDVHHITPLREFRNGDGEVDYEAANELDNLVCFCRSCHQEYEGIPVVPKTAN